MSYRDLLAEAARRQDAEQRAHTAETKLRQVQNILTWSEDEFHLEVPQFRRMIQTVLDGDS